MKNAFFTLVCVFSLVTAVSAQQQTPVQVSSQRIVEGEIFQITMAVPQISPDQVIIENLRMPAGLQLIESYTEYSSSASNDSRVVVRLRALRSGFFEVPALRVSASGREMSSGAILIQVHPSRGSAAPMEAFWEIDTQSPVAGQSIVVSLRLRSDDARAFPGAITFSVPDWGDFRELGSTGLIRSTEYSTGTLHTVPVQSFLATPMSAGEYVIPAAQLEVNGNTVRAESLAFEVARAPQALQSSLAIGEYFFSVHYSSLEVLQGEIFELTLRLEGSGNIPYVQFPEPEIENLLQIGTEDRERVAPDFSGFTGTRTRVFRYNTRDTGRFMLSVPAFSWYDPVENRIRTVAAQTREILVRSVPLGESEVEDGRSFAILSSEAVSTLQPGSSTERRNMLFWLLPAIFGLMARYLLSHKSGRIVFIVLIAGLSFPGIQTFDAMLEFPETEELVHGGEFDLAHEQYQLDLTAHSELPGLWYNAGIAAYRAGSPVEAVYAFRKSILLRPQEAMFHEALSWLEQDQNLNNQASLPSQLAGGSLMVVTLFSLIIMSALWLFYKVRKLGGIAVIFLFFAISAFAFSIADFQLFQRHSYRSALVISDEPAGLYRIPVQSGEAWMKLPPGTAVHLLGQSEDFFLVETGPGLRGWVEESVLREL